ncbi:MAG: glycoside hydrolase family 3 protein [Oscillospiraceae bacterium]
MIDLKAKPFCLSDADCAWVTKTVAGMSDEEKVGQLFFAITSSYEDGYLKDLVGRYHLGGCRYNTAPGAVIRRHNEVLQQSSAIPLFIACNTESGGDNACSDGTFIGSGIKIGATGEKKYAYALGKMSNEEAAAVGCNMAFAPVSDIAYNWENTEVISRSFGSDPKQVAKMSCAYLKGAHTIEGFACAAKHFPGNGLDFRDAHLSNNVNDFSPRRWNATYGKVYRALIQEGLEAVMAGHIMLPKVAKSINGKLKDEDMMPATLSPEIITGLLRERLGFNGLVITDATHMVGMTCRMKRGDMLVQAVNAGCDMLLFFNDPDEDFATVLNAYREGVISDERMEDALTRILALKAHMGLHRKDRAQLVPSREAMEKALGKKEYVSAQKEISEKGITLVKYKDADVLPLTPERYKRIMLVHIKGAESGMTALMKAVGMAGGSPVELLQKKLTEKGFEVFVYENPLDKMKRQAQAGEKPDFNEFFAGKSAIADFTAQMDLVITVCDVASGRPCFGLSKGGGEIPWYVFEVPVVVVGCASPTMLADIPQARTYINTYDAKESTLDALVDKLMKGPSAFRGKDPIDSFCGLFDARL